MQPGVQVALVGCGGMGIRHLVGFADLEIRQSGPGRLVAVCDRDPDRALAAANHFERLTGRTVSCFESLDQVLTEGSIDAVDLVIPTRLHHEAVVESLSRGRHVMVEKPFGLTIRACDLMREAAIRSGLVLAVAENYRRVPSHRALRAAVSGGAIGVPYLVTVHALQPQGGEAEPRWFVDRRMVGSSPMLELAVHEADLLRYILGEVVEVQGLLATFEPGVTTPDIERNHLTEDAGLALLQFDSGAIGQLMFFTAAHGGATGARMIAGSLGRLESRRWESWEQGRISTDGNSPIESDAWIRDWLVQLAAVERERLLPAGSWDQGDLTVDVTKPLQYGIATEIHDFATAIAEHRPPEVGADEGTRSVAICLAILESAQLHKPVTVEHVRAGVVRAWQVPFDLEMGLA